MIIKFSILWLYNDFIVRFSIFLMSKHYLRLFWHHYEY